MRNASRFYFRATGNWMKYLLREINLLAQVRLATVALEFETSDQAEVRQIYLKRDAASKGPCRTS